MITLAEKVKWLNRAHWWIACMAGIALVAHYFLFYRPSEARLAELHRDISRTQLELQKNREAARDLTSLQSEVAKLQRQLETSRNLPERNDLSQFLSLTNELSKKANIVNFKCQPGDAKRLAMCNELPVTLRFQGHFSDIARFLLQAEEMPRLMRTRKLILRNKDDKSGIVDAELALSIFYTD